MKRLFILAFILLFTLTACGGSHVAPVSPKPLSPAESSELTFYESAFEAAMRDAEYLSAAAQAGITTDYMDAAATEEIISQQQAFAESLSQGFWFD